LREVRSKLDRTRQARILFCVSEGQIVLLHGFIKKARTTPRADLDLARVRQKEVGG
jgi:phage-related protein